MTDVSLIISTIGRTEPLRRLLLSLRELAEMPLEVIIVDQNGGDLLVPVLQDFADLPIIHLRSGKGLSRGRNAGLRQARGAIVGFPDDDCWYPHDVLGRVRAFFTSRPEMKLLTGCTTDRDGVPSVSPHLEVSADITRANIFSVGNSNTVFVRRDLAVRVNGFNEQLGVGSDTPFQSGEETDFLLKCLAAGERGFFDRQLIVHHDQTEVASEKYIARVRSYSVGFGRVVRIHRFGLVFVAEKLARASAGALICVARRDFTGASQRRAWILGTLQGYTATR